MEKKRVSVCWTLLLIGLYFLFCKAGPPYQDPTLEMSVRYLAYFYAGKLTLVWGGGLLAAGLAGHFINRIRRRDHHREI